MPNPTSKRIGKDLHGDQDRSTFVCWHSGKVTESLRVGKGGWNYSLWHILKPGQRLEALCHKAIHYGDDTFVSYDDPTEPIADTDGRTRGICKVCLAMRRSERNGA